MIFSKLASKDIPLAHSHKVPRVLKNLTYFERINDPVLLVIFLIFAFCLSLLFVIVAGFIFTRRGERDLYAVQTAHDGVVPRLGGFAMFLTFLFFLWSLNFNELKPIILTNFDVSYLYFLLASSLPVFIVGLAEDLGYLISPSKRLLASFFSGGLVVWLFDVWVKSVGIPIIDTFFSFGLFGIIFTLIAASGVVNASILSMV